MKRFAILACAAVLTSASAEVPAAAPSVAPQNWVASVVPPGATHPTAVGVHNCLSAYPEKERAAGIEGITSLTYRIAEDGSVKSVKVAKSSGNAALDKAAVACVTAWQYVPARLDEKPVEIDWRNDVKWAISANPILVFPAPIQTYPLPQQHLVTPPPPPPGSPPPVNTITTQSNAPSPPPILAPGTIGKPHVCLSEYPMNSVFEHEQGTTTIGFTITTEGRVTNLHVVTSSGYAALDEAALQCSAGWLYKPAIKDNAPIAVPWKAMVKWLLH